LNKPYVILIGSASGIGKSTVAYELAKKLNIKHLIETDFIREVVRGIIGSDYGPALHKSSFDAYTVLRSKRRYDSKTQLIEDGFVEHASFVVPAVEKVICRAVKDNDDIIIEGVHLIPGLVDLKQFKDKANIHFFVLSSNEESHKDRFVKRAMQIGRGGKQLEFFLENRLIHNYLVKKAEDYGVPVVDTLSIDGTVIHMMNIITKTCENLTLKSTVDQLRDIADIIIYKHGGVIGDVSYELPGFKEPLVRKLDISNPKDFEKFFENLNKDQGKKESLEHLYNLSNNIRKTIVCAHNRQTLDDIKEDLDKKGFLVKE
jgi:2-phosphoglycerate kinase